MSSTSIEPSTSTSITHTIQNHKRNIQHDEDEKQYKRLKIIDPIEEIIRELSLNGISKDIAGIITHLSIPPAVTAFYTLIQYCIQHNPTDAEITLDPVTEDELKQVEDKLGYTLPDDVRSIYLIHRNALCDHSFSENILIPPFSTISNPNIRADHYDYKETSSDVIHYGEEEQQNTWKLYHCKYGCIMQYCEEPDMDYLPRMLWFSITHLLLSYVNMIRTFIPYWLNNKKYDVDDSINYHKWEEKQMDMICETENGASYERCIVELMNNADEEQRSWESVINEFNNGNNHYFLPLEADDWAQQHRAYDISWDSKHVGMKELSDALLQSIRYT